MTREEITQLNTDYLNDCESEHEMNELFYYALELQKHEQESSCPYYVIDEDGHGLCKNHRLEQEPILDKIRAEIEHIGGDDEKTFCKNLNESYKQGLKDALKVIDKYKTETVVEDGKDD